MATNSRQRSRHLMIGRLGSDSTALLVAMFCVSALILGFGLLAEEVVEGDTAAFDRAVISLFRNAQNVEALLGPAWLQELGRDVTALGSFEFLGFVFVATVGYLVLVRKRALAILISAAVLGGVAISSALKIGFDRPRPDLPHAARVFTASFPSGHATVSAITFLTLAAVLTRANADGRVKAYFIVVAVFLTLAVGVSRLYLGVHYPSDVLAGWCVGSAWALVCWTGALWFQRRGEVEEAGRPAISES